jgi:hypothetical protein
MNDLVAEELILLFLQSHSPVESAYDEINIQELIFLINRAKYLMMSQKDESEWLIERMKEFYIRLKEKIKAAEELYIAYDQHTNYPYVDIEGRVWIFSNEQYAAEAEDYYLQQFIMLFIKKISGDEITKTFGLLHLLGLPFILVDNGQYYIEVNRDELLPPMDWNDTPENQIPVTNPDLQHAMILFFQTMRSRQNTPDKEELLQSLENNLIDETIKARYLIPMQLIEQNPSTPDDEGTITLKQGDRIQFAILETNEKFNWLPVFTDWFEFEKMYSKERWSSYIGTYEDILELSTNMTGVLINPQGIGLKLDATVKANIEKHRQEKK